MIINFTEEEINEGKRNIINFNNFKKPIYGKFEAESIVVFFDDNKVRVLGKWHKNRRITKSNCCIEIQFNQEVMKKIRNGKLTAYNIINLRWEKWYVAEKAYFDYIDELNIRELMEGMTSY